MSTTIRRAAGTQTFADVLLSALRIRRLTTEKDLADLRTGSTLQVFCASSTLGTVRMAPIGKGRTIPLTASGYLHLTAEQASWQNRRTRESVALQGPFGLAVSEKKAGLRKMIRLDLTAGGEQHMIVIPKADVPLVTQALDALSG
ncbi:hypothetical protein ACFZB9_06900 [Kitasatospora sp. NPDC008050]|uniref:hypothetical protein n=1 Tax=Kitasatospora sp. NPDC008050 TaxID=3364021 RepID=UPI0036E898CE